MAERCQHHLAVWKDWQSLPEEEPLPPEVCKAIRHIASCPNCLGKAPRMVVDVALKPSDEEQAIVLLAFLETERDDGIEWALRKHPAIATYLARNPHPFKRAYALRRAASRGLGAAQLPADVEHSIRAQMQPFDWPGIFFKKYPPNEQLKPSRQPKVAVEFYIDSVAKRALFSTIPVLGISLPSDSARVRVEHASHGPKKAVAAKTDHIEVNVVVDPETRTVRLLLPDLKQYLARLPEVVLFSQDGRATAKTARRGATGYEVIFPDLESGSYMIAVDVIEATRTRRGVQAPPKTLPTVAKEPRRVSGSGIGNTRRSRRNK